MNQLTIDRAGQGQLNAALLDSMFRLRHDVFHDRLGWQVRSERGREHDWYDLIGPHYLVARNEFGSDAIGCWRLLPTTGPYMLRDVFPMLLDGSTAPTDPRVWEISRFAVATEHAGGTYGFSTLPAEMLRAMLRFGVEQGLDAIIGVTSAAVERMLRQLGFKVERLGRPQKIGKVMSVAFRLPLDERTQEAVCGAVISAPMEQAA
ncbi:MAG: acyl-homoserine-lactone synthase [Dokdonella sp.]